MRPGAVLLNFSREGVVSDDAVLAALAAGTTPSRNFPSIASEREARLPTTMLRPRTVVMRLASSRASVSVALPAVKGTTKRMFCEG